MNWKKYLPIIGIILFVYILIKLDIFKILDEIKNVDYFLIILSLIVVLVMLITQTLKWFIIAKKQKINILFKNALKINLISNFYGFVTPSKLGTIVRVEYLKKYTKNIGKGIGNFVLDKIMDISSVFFIAILFSFIFKNKLELPIWIFVFIFLVFVLTTLFFINKKRSKIVLGIIYNKFLPKNIKEKAKITFDSFYEDMPKKRYFIVFFLLNVLNWAVIYYLTYLIALSLGINLSLIYFLGILPIGTIIGLIPISINGLGTREAALIGLFGVFGVSAAKVFSMSILSILITGIIPSLIAAILIFKKRL